MRVKLKVQGVTDIVAKAAVSLLILTDQEEKRQLTIIVDSIMRTEFALRRGKFVGSLQQRANCIETLQNRLPETLCSMIKYLTNIDLCVTIVNIYDGQYHAILEDQRTGTAFHIRVSDGALLTYGDPTIPLYIDEELWNAQSTPYNGEKAKGISIPLNTLSVAMLKEAMQKCINEEKYEAAAQIKQELERRA